VGDYSGVLAEALEACNRAGEVEKLLNGALRSDPASAELQFHIGAHHQRSMRFDAAFASFRLVVSKT